MDARLDPRWEEFFRRLPDLYWAAQKPVHAAYQRLLYTVEHPLAASTTDAIETAFGLPHPHWNPGSRREAIALLDGMRYPSTSLLSDLRAVSGMDLRVASHYLHFFHHAYPIYDRASCKGLGRLGVDVPYVVVRDASVYGLYVEAVERLKEACPYWGVPETNVVLTRIVQAGLAAYGAEPLR